MSDTPLTGPLAEKAVNTIRMLALDAVEKAKCGHPGLPMGAADFAYTLWTRFLRHDPTDPSWINRDRFILSAGHGSMLLYSLLHLFGYAVSIDDLKAFRQLHSITPGHPEYGMTPGVETTAGPLGQGFGAGVGMAIAGKMLAARFNTPEHRIIDNTIYCLCSDGDLMEGVSHEAASLAGHLRLDNLVYVYDDNHVTIEGSTDLAYSDDVQRRFEGYHWFVQKVDGHDRPALAAALERAIAEKERPSLIIARTHIGYGSPNLQDTAEIHGAAIGPEETKATKENLGWPLQPEFFVPDDVRALFAPFVERGKAAHAAWSRTFRAWRKAHPDKAALWDQMMAKAGPKDLTEQLLSKAKPENTGTRRSSGATLQVAADLVPSLVGGSADLSPSTNTILKKYSDIAPGAFEGRNFHFGVREHGMGCILNGLALYGGFIPYGATFLVFADYMRPPIRIAAIMKAHTIYVFTHDSIFVGEDGPTHQAVEQVAVLRAIPGLTVIRPCGAPETAVAWAEAVERTSGPTALILSRQNIPPLDPATVGDPRGLRRGAYVLREAPGEGAPDLIVIASGSEVPRVVAALPRVEAAGLRARVVSMPSQEIFEEQPQSYRDEVLPPACAKRAVVEAGVRYGWDKYIGPEGLAITIDRFGVSGPYKELEVEFGFTPEAIAEKIIAWCKR